MRSKITYVLETNSLDIHDQTTWAFNGNKTPFIVVENGRIIEPSNHDLEGMELIDWLRTNPDVLKYEQRFLGKTGDMVNYYQDGWVLKKLRLNKEEEFVIEEQTKNEVFYGNIQQVNILIRELVTVFEYFNPSEEHNEVYGIKLRNIILLACMEVEVHWKALLLNNGYQLPSNRSYQNTTDYVKLKKFINFEAKIKLRYYQVYPEINPFKNWDSSAPTTSIPWYDSYNKIKHNRQENISLATLKNAIDSLSALLILMLIRYNYNSVKENVDSNQFIYSEQHKNDDVMNYKVLKKGLDIWEPKKTMKVKYFERFPD